MDQTYLLLLGMAILVAVAAGSRVRARMLADHGGGAQSESPFAVSTEGEKVCPRCGMGNLWTESRCISCGNPLKG
jgi:hypothetical protein